MVPKDAYAQLSGKTPGGNGELMSHLGYLKFDATQMHAHSA